MYTNQIQLNVRGPKAVDLDATIVLTGEDVLDTSDESTKKTAIECLTLDLGVSLKQQDGPADTEVTFYGTEESLRSFITDYFVESGISSDAPEVSDAIASIYEA